ncbi:MULTISPECIES: Stk1 family PASTA domain-containing Ser/Thr kinase [Bacillus]|uniref:Stk1 family PASTA domain-containing Ser/Thr kinase n=1 Tax=Bacillus TaxID=1386 RepID=UPI000BB806AF|nr:MULTISPECIES: Stk1 family PASTA domain-containing Ser/Thr kinase [Bacillus]
MLIGKRLNGRYKILEVIGGGGMATVYLAHDMILARDVAVKVLRLDFANDDEFIRRFRREAQSATSLDHPNIVSIYDIGEEDDIYYIVMEHVSGKTLKQYIQQHPVISMEKIVSIMKQLTSAIAHAHENGIIHRDIKPQNILLDHYGNIKVTDFGIAMALSSTTITQTNSLLGSVHYLSPEQARGGLATKKSDVYALGIVLFELLTGTLPFSGESAVSIALKHLQSDTPSPRKWNRDIPQSLENVVLKSMAKDAFHRYDSVEEMHEDITTALNPERFNEPKFVVPMDDGEATKAIPILKGIGEVALTENTITKVTPAPVQKAEKEQNPKKKKAKKFFIILSTILILLVAGTIAAFAFLPSLLLPKDVEIPDVATLEYEEAVEALKDHGFIIDETIDEPNDEIEENHVIRTRPRAGQLVKEGTPVTIFRSVGKEKAEMEDYRTYSEDDARRRLALRGLTQIEVDSVFSEDVSEGIVMNQDPLPGTLIIPDDTIVTLTISKGSSPITLNNYEGSTIVFAQNHLAELDLALHVNEEFSDEFPVGNIIKQDPAPNSQVKKGDLITLTVSKGPEMLDKTTTIDLVIPYEADEEGVEQTVQIFIDDLNHNSDRPFETFKITENTPHTISITVAYKGSARYAVLVDDKEVDKGIIEYDDLE